MRHINVICFLLLGFGIVSIAQTDVPDVTSTFAISNTNVVVKPGTTLTNATVIIKDGYIQQVGNNVTIPFDAEVIPGDSMFVYAGFIAGLSHIGLKKEEEENNNNSVKAHNPPPSAAGITPEVSVIDLLDPKHGTINGYRKEGFTLAHVVPKGRMIAGKGSVILLSGDSPAEMILKEDMSLYGSLQASKNRVFPATTIGVMSKWRELYRQAELAMQHEKKFNSAAVGIKRPTYGKSIKSMYSTTSMEIPIFFHAPKTLDLSRAMTLQSELGFSMVAVNTKQAYKQTEPIKRANLPIVISVDLPKPEKTEQNEEKDPESKAFRKRMLEAKKEHVSQASSLAKSNILFSLSVTDSKAGDVKKNLLRMIEAGLSEEDALAALTTNAASILGIGQLAGTVEKGKLANLIVSDTIYFKEKSNIRYVFVDGKKYEQEVKKKKKDGDPDAVIDMAGTWDVSLSAEDMEFSGTIEMEKSEDGYTGSIVTDMSDETEFDSVEVDGNQVTIKMTGDVNGSSAPIEISLVVDGEDFEGTVDIANGMMSAVISGSKVPN